MAYFCKNMINFNIKILTHNLQIISKLIPTLLKKLNKNVEKTLIPLNFSAIIQFKTQISGFRIKNKIKNTIDMSDNFRINNFGVQEITNFKLKQSVFNSKNVLYFNLMEKKNEL